MVIDGGGWTRVAFSFDAAANSSTVPNDFMVNSYRRDLMGMSGAYAASMNPEKFSKLLNTTDAMLSAPSFAGSLFIENGLGIWQYDTVKCTGTLRHTSRTAGCAGQSTNDHYDSADMYNISINGNEGIVPSWNNSGNELCYPGQGSCAFEFYLR